MVLNFDKTPASANWTSPELCSQPGGQYDLTFRYSISGWIKTCSLGVYLQTVATTTSLGTLTATLDTFRSHSIRFTSRDSTFRVRTNVEGIMMIMMIMMIRMIMMIMMIIMILMIMMIIMVMMIMMIIMITMIIMIMM